jgi:DNA-binding MarR family transcriptional regulator
MAEDVTGSTELLDGHDRERLRLWLRMLVCSNLMERELRSGLRVSFDITLPQFDLLAALHDAPEGMTMTQLSQRMMVSNGNVTGVVERLERDGDVQRESKPGDRRSSVIRLTAAGRSKFIVMAREHHGWVADMLADLTAEEVRQLSDLLSRARRSVEKNSKGG